MNDRRPLTPAERLAVEDALEAAFAPLRLRRASVSPLRVRAAVRWGRGAPPSALPWSAAIARLSELSIAVGMSAMVFVGAFGPAAPVRPSDTLATDEARDAEIYPVPRVTAPLEDETYLRWLRLDRYVPLQDWLDPTVVRTGAARASAAADPPLPTRGPY